MAGTQCHNSWGEASVFSLFLQFGCHSEGVLASGEGPEGCHREGQGTGRLAGAGKQPTHPPLRQLLAVSHLGL